MVEGFARVSQIILGVGSGCEILKKERVPDSTEADPRHPGFYLITFVHISLRALSLWWWT
ncbi:hypothetical protein [Longimicrobium sp.]|uniref:hypothetical protein n=1 Tax=Longimicrobium sp. TaxID=2029185 RepID=UPI002E2F14CF|nr:hypothetical protein [Longimicrobium sp.]HEX6040447.1 hypothetical protein [Longimicrobium sp.]